MHKRRLKWIVPISVTAAILFTLLAIFLYQNSYDMTEQSVSVPTTDGVLTGILTMPRHTEHPVGLIVFVHGDGPIDASYDGFYRPVWERFAKAGYASLSLDKRGIGGSAGSWLQQSMDDRANDTVTAIRWARTLPSIDPKRIGLWGASQAGWVIPKVVAKEPSLAFSILVSPAINWIRQGRYNTRQEMLQSGASEQEIRHVEQQDQLVLQLLKRHASYADYLRITHPVDPISAERWTFIVRNYQSDASQELRNFHHPVHLILGTEDINVDVKETEHFYRHSIPNSLLSVTVLPGVDHSMVPSRLVHSSWQMMLTAIFFPRQVSSPAYLNDLEQFLSTIPR
ncbi:alpha/beta hydrolase family protein [Paenibacillus dauci]|uniref:alpha/beta hydrolase family protein n=1 Tax=Paenibacillus dauci TaxID=1567106 RepID=UPI0006199A6C|nr:alpha/beta hydrolase [Paenibacillus dauci]